MNTVRIREALSTFWSDQNGVVAIEYALLAALIAIAIVVSVGALGESVMTFYDEIAARVAELLL